MKIKSYASLLLLALFLSFQAQAEALSPNLDSLTEIASLIRWSGVFISMLVLFIAWLMLKFTQNIVDSISSQFAQRRMLAQKLQSFFQFFVYMTAGISVFMLSFRVDDRVLTLIGGTLAVSVGFAMKDLAASFIAGLTVMIDRPFQVGDRVTFEGHYGDIIAIGLTFSPYVHLN